MGLLDLFQKSEALLSLDIGSSSIKLVELDTSQTPVKLLNIGKKDFTQDVFSNNVLTKVDAASEALSLLLEANSVDDKRVATAVPGPSVFTKKIKMQNMPYHELSSNIQFEASNFIPHNIDAVKLDFHILGESGKNQLDILIVAVKSEVVESFLDCLSLTGLQTAIVDVDYFALQNIFEHNYPELFDKTVAVIDMGARFSNVNIVSGGQSLFTGDLGVGGNTVTDALEAELGISSTEAEELKTGGDQSAQAKKIIEMKVDELATELNRQLSFFWSASGSEEGIDQIMLTGGGSQVTGLFEGLADKTGLPCDEMDPFKEIDTSEGFDPDFLNELRPQMAVALGLGLRQPGDREIPDYLGE